MSPLMKMSIRKGASAGAAGFAVGLAGTFIWAKSTPLSEEERIGAIVAIVFFLVVISGAAGFAIAVRYYLKEQNRWNAVRNGILTAVIGSILSGFVAQAGHSARAKDEIFLFGVFSSLIMGIFLWRRWSGKGKEDRGEKLDSASSFNPLEELLTLCRGDRALAKRLVTHEKNRDPRIETEEAIRRATSRLERDNA